MMSLFFRLSCLCVSAHRAPAAAVNNASTPTKNGQQCEEGEQHQHPRKAFRMRGAGAGKVCLAEPASYDVRGTNYLRHRTASWACSDASSASVRPALPCFLAP